MPIGLQIIFMDAGQGDATLITMGDGSRILVDCGSKKNKAIVSDQIAQVLEREVPDRHLHALILTHPDGDHYNLVNKLIIQPDYTVDRVGYGCRPEHYTGIARWIRGQAPVVIGANTHDINPRPELSGTDGHGAPIEVYIISANVGDLDDIDQRNLNSVVLFIRYLEYNIFLMGDSTEFSEDWIGMSDDANGAWLSNYLRDGRTLLKVGHHGSDTSTSQKWVDAITPQVAFISSDTKTFGKNGPSLPRSTIVNRLLAGGILDFGVEHNYVQYNDDTKVQEEIATTHGIYTTLNQLKFTTPTEFTTSGVSYYYTIETDGAVNIQTT
jgi:beta-lactamase superfamily II metal-dependent hydrolase